MKRVLLISLLSIGLVVAASAQPPGAPVLEMRYFAIESSIVIGYSLPAAGITTGSSFLLDVAVADTFTFGVQATMLDTTAYTAMKLGYYRNDLLGFSAMFGGDGTTACVGAGAFVTLRKHVREAALADAIKLRLEYIVPDAGIADGAILMAAGFRLGL